MLTTAVSTDLNVEQVTRAALLPTGWDTACGTFLRQTRMLNHYERTNPCRQCYYCLMRDGAPVAGAIVYSLTQNLLTFLGDIHSPVTMNVVGLPASLSRAGVWGSATDVAGLLDRVFAREKGLTLVMNLPVSFPQTRGHRSRLLPGMIFRNPYRTLAEYERNLRSHWRRRLKSIQRKFAGVQTVRESCVEFTHRHHAQYLDVLSRAPHKLETLHFDFFRELPEPIELVSCYRDVDLLCWRLLLRENDQLYFLLGGHDYDLCGRFDVYFNNLLGVLTDGIDAGAGAIDFGQTAEDPKARLGATPRAEQMLLHHSHPLCHRLVGLAAPLLAYRKAMPAYHVFKTREPGS